MKLFKILKRLKQTFKMICKKINYIKRLYQIRIVKLARKYDLIGWVAVVKKG